MALAIAVNLGLTVAQIVGGIFAGSLALIADALHNFSDAIALIIAFAARKIARRPSNSEMTFGYARVEVVAALVNYVTLIIIGLFLAYEAVVRFFDPQQVSGWIIVIIAAIALAVDVATALLTYSMSKNSVNIRAAFLHNVADALGSVAVIVAGTLIILFDWWLIDPLATLLISGYILWQSAVEIGPVMRILMLGSPPDIASEDMLSRIRAIPGVCDVHHVHFWLMDEHDSSVDAHLVVDDADWPRVDGIKASVKDMLKQEFGIDHATLETERSGAACASSQPIGHAVHSH